MQVAKEVAIVVVLAASVVKLVVKVSTPVVVMVAVTPWM
jgi:hypothetical protein